MKKISLDESTSEIASKDISPKTKTMKKQPKSFYVSLVVVILLGLVSGYFLARSKPAGTQSPTTSSTAPEDSDSVMVGEIYGYPDEDEFPDEAVGVLVAGGIDGEGSHHLLREFQDPVYLTSSVLDLDLFVGSKVKVTGQTFNAKKAGWLMDAGSVEVLELDAQIPEE